MPQTIITKVCLGPGRRGNLQFLAILLSCLTIAAGVAYTWRLVEGSKAANGLRAWLGTDFRVSPVFYLWGLSVVLGAITLTSTSAACRGIVRGPALIALWAAKVTGLTVLTFLTTTDLLVHRTPYFFGTGGTFIAALFLFTVLQWGRQPAPLGRGDLLILEGYALFLSAAWFTCGIHTAPSFAIDPKWQREGTKDATAIAHGAMLLWCSAWVCTAAGHWLKNAEARQLKKPHAA